MKQANNSLCSTVAQPEEKVRTCGGLGVGLKGKKKNFEVHYNLRF